MATTKSLLLLTVGLLAVVHVEGHRLSSKELGQVPREKEVSGRQFPTFALPSFTCDCISVCVSKLKNKIRLNGRMRTC